MLFVALLKVRAGTGQERTARRMQWQFPEGVRVLGEYVLRASDPNVIVIFEADSIAPIMQVTAVWDDVFDITVIPAVTAEEGMEMCRQMMG